MKTTMKRAAKKNGRPAARKTLAVWLCVFCLAACARIAMAAQEAEPADSRNPFARRLTRGLSNTAFGWLELPQGIRNIGERHGVGAAATWGVLQGSGRAIQRTAIGIFEVLTFPFGFGHDAKPMIEPESVFSTDESR